MHALQVRASNLVTMNVRNFQNNLLDIEGRPNRSRIANAWHACPA